MTSNLNRLILRCALLTAIVALFGLIIVGQTKAESKTKTRGFCESYNYSNGDRESFRETRETTVSAAGGSLTVDGRRNGGISIIGENRSDVLVRACVQTMGATEEAARAAAKSIRVETAGGTIHAEGDAEEKNWAVSFEIHAPRQTNLKLNAQNGGIAIRSIEGTLDFETVNGGIHLSDVAGSVRGRTTNGGLHVELTGGSWRGGGLDVETTNGGVHLSMPENYAARVETGTVNGGYQSDFSELNVERNERGNRPSRVSAELNGGGAPIRLVTVNGGVHIDATGSKN